MTLAAAVVLALLAQTRTTTASAPLPPTLTVFIYPTQQVPATERHDPLTPAELAAFSAELEASAAEVFAWRRWRVLPPSQVEASLQAGPGIDGCVEAQCYSQVAIGAGATHWVASMLLRTRDHQCSVRVAIYDLLHDGRLRHHEQTISPCSADGLLRAAATLGQKIAEGPRAATTITLNLTPLSVPSIGVADVPNVSRWTRTSTVQRPREAIEGALEVYRAKHMFVFDDEGAGTFYIARGGALLSECDVRRAASAPLPEHIREFCEGNDWEWMWLGVPTGALVAALSFSDLKDGNVTGVMGFGLGTISGIVSLVMAASLNRDRRDVEDGKYPSSREALEEIVARSNEDLRRSLQLTAAEVELAGMRL